MHDFLDTPAFPPHSIALQCADDKSFQADVDTARKALTVKGWSYRTAAPVLGVHHVHLAKVLTAHRESKRLLAAIHQLPNRTEGK